MRSLTVLLLLPLLRSVDLLELGEVFPGPEVPGLTENQGDQEDKEGGDKEEVADQLTGRAS